MKVIINGKEYVEKEEIKEKEMTFAEEMEEMKNKFISICKSCEIPKKEILKLLTLARWIK